jgi:O-antigen/teichoic acid export membrane protein
VAFPLYARLQNNGQQLARAFRAIFSSVSALLFPACALLIALAPGLVHYILGPRWAGTVELIQLLALVNVVGLFGDAVSPLLKGAGQPYKLVVIELLQSSLLIALIWTLTDFFGVLGAALAWIAAVGASQMISAFYVRGLLPRSFSEVVGPVPAIVLVSAAAGLLAWAIAGAIPGLTGFIAAGLISSLLTAAVLFVLDRTFTFGLARDLLLAFPAVAGLVGQGSVESQ